MASQDATSPTQRSFTDRYRGVIEAFRRSFYILGRNRLTIVGIGMVLFIALIGLLAPVIAPYPSHVGSVTEFGQSLQPPSSEHLFGTDRLGRDIFSRVLFGARISMKIAVFVVGAALSIGIPLGLAAGYIGGRVEMLIMRVTDIFVSIPRLILPVAVAGALGPSLENVMLALIVTWWPWYVRLLRSEVKEVKESEYIQAIEGLGASRLRVMFVHLLPNSLTSLLVQATMDMGWVILVAASLSFIGIGASPPTPEWGLMVARGREFMPTHWWFSVFPGLFIFINVMGFNLIGDGLRDILDPKSRME
ncbi:ABC transporter permease [Halorussus marinus]|uniref:ABC transporter permease n=1 Tax=Halorussus marinus TaxID=2505976 RepID=UPI001091D82F|nr:ABC transporter permease [Halorussus marinus]